jgi:hypothetical protein
MSTDGVISSSRSGGGGVDTLVVLDLERLEAEVPEGLLAGGLLRGGMSVIVVDYEKSGKLLLGTKNFQENYSLKEILLGY